MPLIVSWVTVGNVESRSASVEKLELVLTCQLYPPLADRVGSNSSVQSMVNGVATLAPSAGASSVGAAGPVEVSGSGTVTLNVRVTVVPCASVSRRLNVKVPAVVGVPLTRTSGPSGLSWMSDIPGGSCPALRTQVYGRTPPLPSTHRFENSPTASGPHCWGVISSVRAGLILMV